MKIDDERRVGKMKSANLGSMTERLDPSRSAASQSAVYLVCMLFMETLQNRASKNARENTGVNR